MIPLVLCTVVVSCETGYLVPVFEAIRSVETGGMARSSDAVGDNGRSIGPYQISRAYWVDSGVLGDWMRCKDRAFAETVMLGYWRRHCPEALRLADYETLARVHNGGPTGHRKLATLPYWKMIRAYLTKWQTTQSARRVASASIGAAHAPISRRMEQVSRINNGRGRGTVGGSRRSVAG